MSSTFFINESFTVSQTANLYANDIPVVDDTVYDYILDINVNPGAGVAWGTMNSLFANRTFVQTTGAQNDANENLVTLDLVANTSAISDLLYSQNVVDISSTMSNVASNAAYGTLEKQVNKLAGLRFLEIVATKVFGHAKARAAIANDTEYYANGGLIAQIANGITNAVAHKTTDIFNEYVKQDRVQDNVNTGNSADANEPSEFNFASTTWEFPIYFNTVISATGTASMADLNNGPDVGGVQLASGTVNVPILLKFHD